MINGKSVITIFISSIVMVCFFWGCSSPSDNDIKNYYDSMMTDMFPGKVKMLSFARTNGESLGEHSYRIYFRAEFELVDELKGSENNGWKLWHLKGHKWLSSNSNLPKPQLLYTKEIIIPNGTKFIIETSKDFRKTEKGWVMSSR